MLTFLDIYFETKRMIIQHMSLQYFQYKKYKIFCNVLFISIRESWFRKRNYNKLVYLFCDLFTYFVMNHISLFSFPIWNWRTENVLPLIRTYISLTSQTSYKLCNNIVKVRHILSDYKCLTTYDYYFVVGWNGTYFSKA